MWAAGGLRRQVPADAAASQFGKAGRPAFPLLPDDGAQPSPGPLVKVAQHRRGLAEAEVAAPSDQVDGQLLDDLREAPASGAARQFPYPTSEPGQRNLDQWIRRRLRAIVWKQWKRGPTRRLSRLPGSPGCWHTRAACTGVGDSTPRPDHQIHGCNAIPLYRALP